MDSILGFGVPQTVGIVIAVAVVMVVVMLYVLHWREELRVWLDEFREWRQDRRS
jgi:hypothetical protein